MSAYSEILAWSRSRPAWQQDALRKVALGVWQDDDVAHAAQMIKAARNVAPAPAQPPVPLSEDHLPKQGGAADPVRLVGVREVANVALLAPGQKLPFARFGLTAVYGDNGSGKTSYSRILKCACRARGARPDVLPSVYSTSPRGTPTALVDYEVGDRQSTFKWCAEAGAPDALSQVSVFDAATRHRTAPSRARRHGRARRGRQLRG